MDCFIKKIFMGKEDEEVHRQFVRFGKGKFEKKAALALNIGEKIKFRGSFEYASEFVRLSSEIGAGKAAGVVLSKSDISTFMSQNGIKAVAEEKKGGLFFKNELEEQEIKPEVLGTLVNLSYFALLDVTGKDFTLKMKKNLPKPGKSGDAKIDDKFCQMEADPRYLKQIKDGFFWDVGDCKKASVHHAYVIDEIILPKDEKDFDKIRILAKRKGRITRNLSVDGKEEKTEKELLA